MMAAGENGSEQRTIGTNWRWRYQAFLLFLANSWAQEVSAFQQKQFQNLSYFSVFQRFSLGHL
jgi:hypothetical protein